MGPAALRNSGNPGELPSTAPATSTWRIKLTVPSERLLPPEWLQPLPVPRACTAARMAVAAPHVLILLPASRWIAPAISTWLILLIVPFVKLPPPGSRQLWLERLE